MKFEINSIIALLGAGFSYLFGGIDVAIITLVIFMALDFTTGVIVGFEKKEANSERCWEGIFKKKAMMIIVLIAGVSLDRLLANDAWLFRTLICYFYIGNEGISLLENAAFMGLPIPKKLVECLEQLKEKEN